MLAPAYGAEALSANDRSIAARAFEAADRDQFGKAEEIAETASDKLPLKILQWIDFLRPAAGHSFAEISAFIEANPDWPKQSTLRARAEESIGTVPDATLHAWYAEHKTPLGSCPDPLIVSALTPCKKSEPEKPSVSLADYDVPDDLPEDIKARLASFEDLCVKDWSARRAA